MPLTLRGTVRLGASLAIIGAIAAPMVSAQAGASGFSASSTASAVAVSNIANVPSGGTSLPGRAIAARVAGQAEGTAGVRSAASTAAELSAAGKTGAAPLYVLKDPTDTGKCDGKLSGTYGGGKCQNGYVGVWADPYSGVQVGACNGNPGAAPSGSPQQPYGYIYFDSSGKHAPGDYGNQAPTGGYIGANNNQSQNGKGAAPCDYQP